MAENVSQSHTNGKTHYQILGIGTPIVDLLIQVQEDYIKTLAGDRGGSSLVSYRTLQKILQETPQPLKVTAGGSAANTIKGLAALGYPSALIGKIGDDLAGQVFSESILSCGITPHLSLSHIPTAQVASLITPDCDRTMRTFIGAGADMTVNDLTSDLFQGVKLVHIEGYLMNRHGVVEKTMQLAKEAGAIISFDVSSFEMATEYKKPMIKLLSHFVDIVFANEEESLALSGMPAERACMLLKDICTVAVIKMGKQGSWGATGTTKIHQKALDVPVIDTTGAGDLFASGFLYSFIRGKSLEESLRCGAIIASHVVQNLGAEIPKEHWPMIKSRLEDISDGSI